MRFSRDPSLAICCKHRLFRKFVKKILTTVNAGLDYISLWFPHNIGLYTILFQELFKFNSYLSSPTLKHCVWQWQIFGLLARKMSGPTQTFDHSISGSDSEPPGEPVWGKFLAVTPKTCETIHFKLDEYTFGRGKGNDIVLEHPGISGVHCKVWREAIEGMNKHTVWIEDKR